MNWIIASILTFISSAVLYLFVRRSNSLKTPQQLNNLAMYFIPLIVYLIMAMSTDVSFGLKPFEYIVILIQAIFFSYLGNVLSLKGIQLAPNPGYSLIISKSYVVFTSIASIFIFGAPLSVTSAIAIMIIVVFSALIMINNKSHDKRVKPNNKWLLYTMGAFSCWGFLALSSKYLLNLGVPVLTRLIYTAIVASMLILGEIKLKKIDIFKVSKEQLTTLLAVGGFGAAFMYFMQVAFNLAPNVGYVNAVNASSISLLTVLSVIIFKDELSARKMIGVVGVTVGLVLLLI